MNELGSPTRLVFELDFVSARDLAKEEPERNAERDGARADLRGVSVGTVRARSLAMRTKAFSGTFLDFPRRAREGGGTANPASSTAVVAGEAGSGLRDGDPAPAPPDHDAADLLLPNDAGVLCSLAREGTGVSRDDASGTCFWAELGASVTTAGPFADWRSVVPGVVFWSTPRKRFRGVARVLFSAAVLAPPAFDLSTVLLAGVVLFSTVLIRVRGVSFFFCTVSRRVDRFTTFLVEPEITVFGVLKARPAPPCASCSFPFDLSCSADPG